MNSIFLRALSLSALAAVSTLSLAAATPLPKLWDASIVIHNPKDNTDFTVPFRFEITGSGDEIKGSFFNGEEPVTSTGGRLSGNTLLLNFDHYASRLEATVEDGQISGKYGNPARTLYPFSAKPHVAATPASAKIPSIDGQWEIEVESPKGEHAWRFIVKQKGAETSAAILRIDGDTGTLTGSYLDGKFLLSHFSGARPSVLEAVPQADGSLQITLKSSQGDKVLTAWRPAVARAKGLPEPSDPAHFTRVKNPDEAFAFSFPNLEGKTVSNTDAQFQGKVVLVNITGSWCPNCHDEAPFLEALYRKYHSQGLEIVALDFEEPEQFKDPARLHAFIKRYGIEFTYLLAGQPSELQAKVPQAENLNSWPTTFFLGRDGKVKAIHAGFAAAASGPYHDELKQEVSETIEQLLAQKSLVSSR